PLERRVNRRDGAAHYIVRALPYWTGSGKVEGAVLTFSDVTGLAQAEEQQRVLVAELNHRVKNMLTVIVSIATQTLKQSDDVEAGRDAFLDRLHAMARAYELVSRDQWGDVSLLDVVRQEVEPYRTGRDDRIAERGGPLVDKPPQHGFGLSLIEREVSHGLGGKAKIEFEDSGLRVNLRIPLDSQ